MEGHGMRVLFVCARNRLRSPTAEQVFSGVAGVETASAGIAPDAEQPLTAELIGWAEVILVMEPKHRARMARAFGPKLRGKRVVCLDIADDYTFMDPELVRLLWERVPRSIPALAAERPAPQETERGDRP
jgi:predicted protein tyrosine phosphatase